MKTENLAPSWSFTVAFYFRLIRETKGLKQLKYINEAEMQFAHLAKAVDLHQQQKKG